MKSPGSIYSCGTKFLLWFLIVVEYMHHTKLINAFFITIYVGKS